MSFIVFSCALSENHEFLSLRTVTNLIYKMIVIAEIIHIELLWMLYYHMWTVYINSSKQVKIHLNTLYEIYSNLFNSYWSLVSVMR